MTRRSQLLIIKKHVSYVSGGDGGHALCLCEDLEEGYTEQCDTFSSNPLCKGRFQIQCLEVWGIQNSIYFSHRVSYQ